MTIKPSVFGSDNERKLFKTLESHWSHKFDLWPNLPFTNIIDISNSSLSDKERGFIYKTSVDYTLCKKEGKPLLSIEFDGLGHGFSKGGKYIQLVPTPDEYRKLKLDLKLRIAKGVGYPLFVVSYDEKEPIGPDLHLTIVDGIIGQVLANKAKNIAMKNLLSKDEKEFISTLRPDEASDYIQDLVIGAEFDAELKWNPVVSLATEYHGQADFKGLVKGWSYYNYIPGVDDDVDCNIEEGKSTENIGMASLSLSLEELRRRIEDIKNADKFCSKYMIETPFGEVRETICVRNIEGHGASGLMLSTQIGELLAFKKVLDLYGDRGQL